MVAVGNIALQQTMVHEVPRGNKTSNPDPGVILSESLTVFDPATDRFIRDQMLAPFLPGGRDIIAVPETGADGKEQFELVPTAVRALLADASSLPEHSRAIAEHIFTCQVSLATAGIFLVSLGQCDAGPCVVILKAEHQEGVRMRHHGSPGHVAFDVEHISELIVGKNSKVYKIAMLWIRDDGSVVGKMVDKQNGVGYADYFLHAFLGMQPMFDAEILTREFMDAMTKQINTRADPEKKTRYTRALVATLEGPEAQLSGTQFISTFIDPEDRDDFAAAVSPQVLSTFRKDVTLVNARIGGVAFSLQNGEVQIKATTHAIESGGVQVEAAEQRIVIRGIPETITPSSSPKR